MTPGPARPASALRSMWRPGIDFLVVPAVFLLVGLLLQGDGRVPLGDSWEYAWTARQLVEHGRLVFTDVQAMTLVAQIFLAAPVAALFSPTPSVLNHFTLVLSAITLDLFLLAYRRLGLGRRLSLVGVAVLATNPLWLTQSMAFETEIPFLFFSALGALAFLRWDRTSSDADGWCTGFAFAGAAAVRQHALVFPFAWLVYAWPARRLKLRSCLPWLLPPLAVGLVYLWLHLIDGVPRAFGWQREMVRLRWSDPRALVTSACFGVLASFHYLGGFLLPVSVVAADESRSRWRPAWIAACVALAASTFVLWLRDGLAMPYLPHLLQPVLLLATLGAQGSERLVELAWTVFSTIAGIGLILALFRSSLAQGDDRNAPAALRFFAASAVFLLGFSLLIGLGWDRYFLPPLPFLIPVLLHGHRASPRRMGIAAALLLVSLAGSALLVDQRVRAATCEWDTAEALRDSGVAPLRINGGVPFNGYYLYEAMAESWKGRKHDLWVAWSQPDAQYLVSLRALDRPGLTLTGTRRCANLPGLRAIEAHTYTCAPRAASESSSLCQPF